jgi:hypothetical protein
MKHNQKKIDQRFESYSWILLKIVQSFVQLADLVDFLFKFRELHDEDVLVNFVVQKRRFDVYLYQKYKW